MAGRHIPGSGPVRGLHWTKQPEVDEVVDEVFLEPVPRGDAELRARYGADLREITRDSSP